MHILLDSSSVTSGDDIYDTCHPSSHDLEGASVPSAENTSSFPPLALKRAQDIDPNKACCAITNARKGVVCCPLVPLNTDDRTLTQLEYAWGMGWRRLDVSSPFNVLFVTKEWHQQFVDNHWLLIPEPHVILSLLKLSQEQSPVKLNKYFQQQTTFKYYAVPQLSLRDEIIVVTPYHGGAHTVHTYPFTALGPIVTHVRPHFVVQNTLAKFKAVKGYEAHHVTRAYQAALDMHCPGHGLKAVNLFNSIGRVAKKWMAHQIPPTFRQHVRPSRRLRPVYRAVSESGTESTVSGSEKRVPFDRVEWVRRIAHWLVWAKVKANAAGWESQVLNDEQVADYRSELEPVFLPISSETWHDWRPLWQQQPEGGHLRDSTYFSSNDWAALELRVLLPVPQPHG